MSAYLTYLEYTELSLEPVDELMFNKLLPRASVVLDAITRDYFKKVDLEESIFKEKFKLAVAMQIDFYNQTGANSYSRESVVNSVSIGRTSMSTGGSSQSSNNQYYDPDIDFVLSGTGLLFRGLCGGC